MDATQAAPKTPQIRLSQEVHRVISILAVRQGISIKSLVEAKLLADEDVQNQAAAEGINLPVQNAN